MRTARNGCATKAERRWYESQRFNGNVGRVEARHLRFGDERKIKREKRRVKSEEKRCCGVCSPSSSSGTKAA